jgi:hypothetical protein
MLRSIRALIIAIQVTGGTSLCTYVQGAVMLVETAQE